jgi:hypothetical protein
LLQSIDLTRGRQVRVRNGSFGLHVFVSWYKAAAVEARGRRLMTLPRSKALVWYGMVWYGMVWYGMVWYGMVWVGYGHMTINSQSISINARLTLFKTPLIQAVIVHTHTHTHTHTPVLWMLLTPLRWYGCSCHH